MFNKEFLESDKHYKLLSYDKKEFLIDFIAGGISGMGYVISTFPIE